MRRHRWLVVIGVLLGCGFFLGLLASAAADGRGMIAEDGALDPVRTADWSARGFFLLNAANAEAAPVSTSVFIPLILHDFPSDGPMTIDKGDLELEELNIEPLAPNTRDRWTMALSAGQRVTVTVAPGDAVDISLSVIAGDGTVLVDNHDENPAGEVETITGLEIAASGQHALLISAKNNLPTDYALMFMDQDSFNFVFRGTLLDGETESGSLPEGTDHFWFFTAQSGDIISFTVTPENDEDVYLELYDNAGERVLTIDDNVWGEPESLINFPLSNAGLYGIRVAEFDFLEMDYQIVFAKS